MRTHPGPGLVAISWMLVAGALACVDGDTGPDPEPDAPVDCRGVDDRDDVPAWDPEDILPLYDDVTNPFTQPIEADPALHPDSAAAVAGLVSQFQDQGMGLAIREWTAPVYLADAATPRVDVELVADWAPYGRLL